MRDFGAESSAQRTLLHELSAKVQAGSTESARDSTRSFRSSNEHSRRSDAPDDEREAERDDEHEHEEREEQSHRSGCGGGPNDPGGDSDDDDERRPSRKRGVDFNPSPFETDDQYRARPRDIGSLLKKPERFSGNSDELEGWIFQFMQYCESARVSQRDRGGLLSSMLSPKVLSTLGWNLHDTTRRTFADMLDQVEDYYVGSNQGTRYQAELAHVKQKGTETCRQYLTRVQMLFSRANRHEMLVTSFTAIESFIGGLSHQEWRIPIRIRKPKTLLEAGRLAEDFETAALPDELRSGRKTAEPKKPAEAEKKKAAVKAVVVQVETNANATDDDEPNAPPLSTDVDDSIVATPVAQIIPKAKGNGQQAVAKANGNPNWNANGNRNGQQQQQNGRGGQNGPNQNSRGQQNGNRHGQSNGQFGQRNGNSFGGHNGPQNQFANSNNNANNGNMRFQSTVQCFLCGRMGHAARTCRNVVPQAQQGQQLPNEAAQQSAWQPRNGMQNAQGVRCYECQGFGHIAANCANRMHPTPMHTRPPFAFAPVTAPATPKPDGTPAPLNK